MRLGPIRPPAAALAAGLPVLLVGLLTSHAPTGQQANADTVRTHLVAPPASSLHQPGGLDEALDGAHPPTDPLVEIVDATGGPGNGTDRGIPIRVTGTALPARVLLAYRVAAADLRASDPACHLPWYLLAGIGQVESGQAYGGAVDRQGRTLNPILGPVLDGTGDFAAIPDTDNGRWDGDKTWDRAVGPMQFIPSSWAVWGRDGDGNGVADPSDIDDAALAAASYLCAGDRDLRNIKDERSAVFSYNHSWDYVDLVLAWATAFEHGTTVVVGGGSASPGSGRGGAGGAGGAGGGTLAGTPVALPSDVPVAAEPAPTQAPPSAAPPDGGATAPASGSPPPPTGPASEPAPTASAPPSPTASPSASCPTPSDTPSGTATPTDTPSPTETPTPDPSGSPSPTGSPTDPIDPCATPTGQPGG
jgi:hypothetical protein